MIKRMTHRKTQRFKSKSSRLSRTTLRPGPKLKNEKNIDVELLDQEFLEDNQTPAPDETGFEPSYGAPTEEAQDRGEDLVNVRDPFVQGPELQAENPPEAPHLLDPVKVPKFNEDLADHFEADRDDRF